MFVLATSIAYVFEYIYAYPLSTPPSWLGWADQPLYLKSSQALWALDFSPSQHHYPIGYSLLAMVPVRVFGPHGFGLLSFALVVGSAALLYKTFVRLVPAAWAVAALVAALILPRQMPVALVTPFTNIAVFAYVSAIAFLYLRETWSRRDVATMGVLFGAVFITRPGDAIYVLPIAIAVAVELAFRRRNWKSFFLFVFCGLTVSALFPLSNKLIYGQWLSHYVQSSSGAIGDFSNFGAKLFSMLFNGVPIYLTEDPMMVQLLPWLVLWPCGIWLLIRGRRWRYLVVQGSVLLGFLYFCSFAPLTPTILRFFITIRVFEPVIALFALPAALALRHLLTGGDRHSWAWAGGVLAITVASMTGVIGYRQIEVTSVSRTISDGDNDVVIVNPRPGNAFRHIFLPSHIGTMSDFGNYHQLVNVDSDTTCLGTQFDQWTWPLPPVLTVIANVDRNDREIVITLPTNKRFEAAILPAVVGGIESCIFCGNSSQVAASALRQAEGGRWIPSDKVQIDLGRGKNSFLGDGWGQWESSHSWMIGYVVKMTLPPVASDREHVLIIEASSKGSQELQLFVNGKAMGAVTFPGKGFQALSFRLPAGALRLDDRNHVEFRLPNAESPKALSIAAQSIALGLSDETSVTPNDATPSTAEKTWSVSFADGGDLAVGPDWQRSADAFVSIGQAGHIRFTQEGRRALQIIASVEHKANQPADVEILVNGHLAGTWHFGCPGRTVRDVMVQPGMLVDGDNDIEIHTKTAGARIHLRRLTVQPSQMGVTTGAGDTLPKPYASNNLQIIPNPKTQHQTGKFDPAENTLISEKGESGWLMYGPYAKLQLGHYQATYLVTAESEVEGTEVGLLNINGYIPPAIGDDLAQVPLKAMRGEQTIKLIFDVESQMYQHQFRVMVNGQGRVKIKSVHVEQIAGTKNSLLKPTNLQLTGRF